jgi:hypothetical protein
LHAWQLHADLVQQNMQHGVAVLAAAP